MLKIANIVFNSFVNDSRVLKESISLSNHGWHVEVIAHLDKGLADFEKCDNFFIKRFIYFDRKIVKNKFDKLKIYFRWIQKSIKYVKDFDVLHCNDLNTLPIAFVVKQFFNKNIKIVYDAHEHESERCHYSNLENKIFRFVESFLLKYVDGVITVSESIAEDYVKIYKIKKPSLVLNAPLYIEIVKKNIFRKKFNIPEDYLIFLYQGGLSAGRGIIEFANLIKNKKNVAYIIMGYGSLENEIKKVCANSDNVYFHEAVSPDILLNYTASADIGVCIEENLCKSWDFALPNKMFEYYMANLPIIVSGLYEMKKFVKENNTGYVIDNIFDQKEFDVIFEDVINTYKDKLKNIKRVKGIYNWEEQEKVLLNVYGELEK